MNRRTKWMKNTRNLIERLRAELKIVNEELARHIKYEGGVSMKCGHPVQCAYAAAKVDGGPVCCSMCDLQAENDKLKQFEDYSYYVGTEVTCGRMPLKYCAWINSRRVRDEANEI